MFCRNCGTKLKDDASFCPQCGSKVERELINNSSKDVSFDSMVKPYVKNNKRKVIIAAVALIAVGVAAVNIPKLVKKVAVQQEVSRTENAIETALGNIIEVEDFSCYVETDASIYEKVDGNQLTDGISVHADITFKDGRVHAENGKFYELMRSDNGGMHIEEYLFESYITEYNQAFTAKDAEAFESVTTGFSKDDMMSFFEEVKANYETGLEYETDEESDEITIRGTLSEGGEIYNTYIDFLNLAVAQPENYPVYGEMNYDLVISKEEESVKSITFYLSDVERIWLGYGDSRIVVENAYDQFTITYKDLSEVEGFELPQFAQEEEKAFDEAVSEMEDWQSAYVSALEDGTIVVSEFCKYALRDLDADGIPELFCYDDSIRSTYLYAFADGSIREVVCRWGGFLINDNLLYSDDNYENAIVYEYSSGKVEELFIAQHDENDDSYYYEGNALSYEVMANIAKEYFGTELDWDNRTLELDFEYDQDSISQAIVENSIAPVASISEDEQQVNVIEDEVIPAYEKYISDTYGRGEYDVFNLIYIDADDIPELLFDNTADGRGTLVISYQNGEITESPAWCRGFDFNYIPRENKMVYSGEMLGDVSGYVAHLENGILVEEHSYYFDLNDATGEGGTYQMDSVECSEEEYNNFVETYFKYEDMVDGWQTYSSIQEAYENLGKITFSECGGYITELEMINNSLTVKTEEGKGISYPIDENCEWLEMGSDGTIYGNHSFETLKEAISRERERYIEAPEFYESPLVLRIEIQNDTIIKICTSTP